MKVLVVEDDDNKRHQLLAFLSSANEAHIVEEARSLMSGLKLARSRSFDAILLDMTLPNYDLRDGETGGGMHAFGGVEFLKQLRRFRIATKVIVVTQFETFGHPPSIKDLPQLDSEMRESFRELYIGSVYYHASIENWTADLQKMLQILDTLRTVNEHTIG